MNTSGVCWKYWHLFELNLVKVISAKKRKKGIDDPREEM